MPKNTLPKMNSERDLSDFLAHDLPKYGPIRIAQRAVQPTTLSELVTILERIDPDALTTSTIDLYKRIMAKQGGVWGYMDHLCVLHAASKIWS